MANTEKGDVRIVTSETKTSRIGSGLATPIAVQTADELHGCVRRVMRHVGSTVTIITTRTSQPFGMVATAMMSLSLDPPSLVVAINESASICNPLCDRGAFCVNVLSSHDEGVSRRFTQLSGTDRFSAGNWIAEPEGPYAGIPFLKTAQASLFCQVTQSMTVSTHRLVVGRIQTVSDRQIDDPLLYCDGTYGGFRQNGQGAAAQLDDRLFVCN